MIKTTRKLIIKARPPFNFDLSAKVFSDEVSLCMRDEEICKYSDGKYWRVLRIYDKLILIVIKSVGDVNKPKLEIELISSKEISRNHEKIVKKMISFMFDLDSDLQPFYEDMRHDEILTNLINRLYGLKVVMSPTVFEALVYVILEQQISLQAAYNIEIRVIKKFGDKMKIDNKIYYAFPTPERLASARIEELRSCGTSQRKAEYIIDIAKSIVEGKLDLEALKHEESEEIMKKLCEIRGIGTWTAELTIIRGMGGSTVIPAADLGLREHVARYYFEGKRRASTKEVREVSKRWGKWKGISGFYLVMAGRLNIDL